MKKKILLPIIIILSMIMLTACSNGPEKTVDGFMKSMGNLEVAKASEYLSIELQDDYQDSLREQEDSGFSFEDMKNLVEFKELESNFKGLAKKLDHKAVENNIDGDIAQIKVDLTYADASEPLMTSIGDAFGRIFGMAFSGQEMTEAESTEMLLEIVNGNLSDYNAETKNTEGIITLEKVNGEWLITELDENTINALTFGMVDGLNEFGESLEIGN